jgi:dipeptidyl aminopeptidase/acylaminoacyl peptidase
MYNAVLKIFNLLCLIQFCCVSLLQAQRPLRPSDYYRIRAVSSPAVSPSGDWVVFALATADSARDKINSDLWMVSVSGSDSVQLTNTPEPETQPQFSSDGKYISFLSSRDGNAQVWFLDRRGGEAKKLTNEKGQISFHTWSADSKKLLLVIKDSLDTTVYNSRKPYVINRYKFKEDETGYRFDTRKNHLHIFDLQSKKSRQLTRGEFNESNPVWSPTGDRVAFASNRTEDPDKNRNTDIWIMDTVPGADPVRLTTWKGADDFPRFSPDGKRIAYIQSASDANSEFYEQPMLCIVDVAKATRTVLSASLDRPVFNHRWTGDGTKIGVVVADDCERNIFLFDPNNAKFSKLVGGERSFSVIEPVADGSWIALMSQPAIPTEIFHIKDRQVKRISFFHQKFLEGIKLGSVRKVQSKSKDGTTVSSLLYFPPNSNRSKTPLVFYLHGGPVSQDEFGFDLTRQILAAGGYLVAGVNYRGSTGRGHEYSRTITGDWGNKEVLDILGVADHLVQTGLADPENIGICGWSYGGMLTTYSIAKDGRFKAAISGAGVAFPLSLYGVDEYVLQYDNEIGPPWKKENLEKYLRISYPFFNADHIKTPTLFMGGDKDFNVPITGSEQMYQALRSLGIPTELVVYPGQFHGLSQPSFIVDRYERYLTWFGKYLGK